MSRRLTPAVLSILVLATASAQAAPPDEHAAAQAFADITLPAAHEIAAVQDSFLAEPVPRCKAQRRLARGTQRQQERMSDLVLVQEISSLTRRIEPTLMRTVAALDAVPTADRRLIDGRDAWRSVRRMYSRLAALPRIRLCSVMRDYVRRDYRPTPAMRRALALNRVGERWDTTQIDRAMAKATERMIALGVTPAAADGFDGELEPAEKPEDEGGQTDTTRGNGKAKGKKS